MKISEIKEITIFFTEKGEIKTTEYTNFDSLMNIKSLKRFDAEDKLLWLSVYRYDSLARMVRHENKRWNNLTGYQMGYSVYEYVSPFNVTQTDYRNKETILGIAKFYFNRNKNLVGLETYTSEGDLIGYELAEYNIPENQMVISQYNREKELINKSTSPISYDPKDKQKPSNKYDQNGDIIYWERDWDANDRTCFTTEYKYDQFNNWIVQKRYRFMKNDKGELKKKKLEMTKNREIKYLNRLTNLSRTIY